MSHSFPSPYASPSIILVQINLGFICSKNLAKISSGFLFINAFNFVVNPLYLLSFRYLLIVDFDNDMPASSWVFLTWLFVVKRIFPHQGKNSRIVNFTCLPWFSRTFGVIELISAQKTDDGHLHWHLFGLHIENSHEQLPNSNSTFSLQTFYLLNLSWNKWTGHIWPLNWIVQLLLSLRKWRDIVNLKWLMWYFC